jgi:hypothetical protein
LPDLRFPSMSGDAVLIDIPVQGAKQQMLAAM